MRRVVLLSLASCFLVVAVSAGSAATRESPSARDVAAGQIYFYANVGNAIGHNNPPLVRPSTLVIFEDGSWTIQKLSWRGWGSSVARATGVAITDHIGSPVIRSAAQLTVSRPRLLFGREVYGCFQLTIPSAPIANLHDCIHRSPGIGYGYGPAGKTSVHPTVPAKSTVRFYTPSGNIACEMTNNGASGDIACIMQTPRAIVHLAASGVVTICQHQGLTCTGNLGDGPGIPNGKLAYGASKTVGRFRCSSGIAGVTCTVTATGKGFFISKQSVKRVG